MALRYSIEDGVVVLSATAGDFAMLRDVLNAAAADPAARPRMPLLIDVRTEANGVRYEDVRCRVETMAEMRHQFGPRWAIVTGTQAVPVGVGRMFAAFSEIEGFDVGMFADEDDAIRWLIEP
jgi:hypothetical protein